VKFTQQKDSSVTVIFDAPRYAEVRIPVRAYIRPDVVVSPGAVEFGTLRQGTESHRLIKVSYAGNPNWKIKEVVPHQPYLTTNIQELSRGAGRVEYQIAVDLKPDAPAGDLRDNLMLLTSDPNRPPIPLLVEGHVDADFALASNVVSVGMMAPGEQKQVNLV